MDVSEINKIASRKRMSVDVEKLREKVSRENKKIIKLKVAQDTAYWDLKEKLRQVETNHEKLQQNMVEVQMQYETVSGQYQDELRHRAETLNKLASTREICTVLEDYSERLRATLSRCKADQAALCDAYQQSGQLVRELKVQQLQQEERSRQTIDSLQEKLKLTTEHHNQLLQYFSEEKQRAAVELRDVKEKLVSAISRGNDLHAANCELGAQAEQARKEIEKKEETISNLQRDVKQLIQEFNSQAGEMKNNMNKIEKDLKEALASNESLKQALCNQETFTKSVTEQRNQLQEKVAILEEQHANTEKLMQDLETKLKEVNQANDQLKTDVKGLNEMNGNLKKEICEKNEVIANSEIELQKLTDQLSALDLEKCEVLSALNQAGVDAQAMVAKVKELTETGSHMEGKIQEIEDALKVSRETAEQQVKELTVAIETKNKELDTKTSMISNLMNEVKNVSDVRSKLEISIQKLRQEMVEEKDAAGEREKRLSMRVEQLEVVVKGKDNELSKNLSVILELRGDKERLNEKIQSMQNTIDNIQKELTRPITTQTRIEPEQDDNAVMLTPASKKSKAPILHGADLGPPAPRKDAKNDSLLFNFLSDSSMDGDNTVDASFVNRRFEAMARGEPLSPMPLSAVKRGRSAVPASQGGLRFKQPSKNEDMISLSQVKASMQQSKPRSFFKNKRNEKQDKLAKY